MRHYVVTILDPNGRSLTRSPPVRLDGYELHKCVAWLRDVLRDYTGRVRDSETALAFALGCAYTGHAHPRLYDGCLLEIRVADEHEARFARLQDQTDMLRAILPTVDPGID